jgi:hypothetical protein
MRVCTQAPELHSRAALPAVDSNAVQFGEQASWQKDP